MAYELMMLFTFLNGWKQIKGKIVLCDIWKLCEIQVSVFINKGYWTAAAIISLCIINGWFWSVLSSKIVSDTMWPVKPKIFACWPFTGKVCWPVAQSNGSQFGAILPSRGRLALSGDSFVCQNWGWGSTVCYWHLVGRDATMHTSASATKNYLVSKDNSAEGEKPWIGRT